MIKVMATDNTFTGPVNIGNPNEMSMIELANLIIQLTGSKSKIVFNPLPLDDPRKRKPDISLAKKILDWEPKVPIQTGLISTIEYFKQII